MAAEHTALIGRRIAEARTLAKLTQSELAAAIPGKAGPDQVSKWERGIHRPGDDTLAYIARATDRDVGWFHSSPADKSNTPALLDSLAPTETSAQLHHIEERLDDLLNAINDLTLRLVTAGLIGDVERDNAKTPEPTREARRKRAA